MIFVNKKSAVFCVLFLCGYLISIQAQSEVQKMTLEQALEYASENAYQKRSSNYDVISAQKKIWETIASGLPQVDFSARYNHSLDLTKSLLPIEFFPEANWPEGGKSGDMLAVSFGTPYDANYNVGVTQLLFDGSYFVGVQATKVFLEFTQQQQQKTEVEIKNAVAQSYFLALSANENINAFNELLSVNEEMLRESRAMFQSGFIEMLDVSQMELLVNDSRKRLMEMKRNHEVAMAVLKFSLGMAVHEELALTDSLSFLAQRIIAGGMPIEIFDVNNHIDYKIAVTNQESQRLFLKNEQVQYLPKISAFYNYQKVGYSDEWNVFDKDWYKGQAIGVQVSIPIFSSGMRNARVQQQKLNWQKSQTQREMVLHDITNRFITAQSDMRNSYEQYVFSIANKDLANDILGKTTVKFRNGIASSSEYTQQQTQFIQAQMSYVQSAVNLMNAHVALLKATGLL